MYHKRFRKEIIMNIFVANFLTIFYTFLASVQLGSHGYVTSPGFRVNTDILCFEWTK